MTIVPAVAFSLGSAVVRGAWRRADAGSGHRRVIAGALAAAVAACAAPAPAGGAGVAAAVPAWHRAVEVVLPANTRQAFNPAGRLDTVACAGSGWCAGGGSYASTSAVSFAMVAAESAGRWARARELRLPANAATTWYQDAQVNSVACTTDRSCVAVGSYDDTGYHELGFLAAESAGKWARAQVVRLPANADAPRSWALLDAVACPRPGSCVAVGTYRDNAAGIQMMAVAESNGRWGRAREIAPPPRSGRDPEASLDAIACWRPGDCWAIGSIGFTGATVAVPVSNGRWGRPLRIGPPSGDGGNTAAQLSAIACTDAASCTAVGTYADAAGGSHPMAVAESDGRWGRAIAIRLPAPAARARAAAGVGRADTQAPAGGVPGSQPLRPQRGAMLSAVSCPRAGSCDAVGVAWGPGFASRAMVVAESNGRWLRSALVPAPANASTAAWGYARLYSVACTNDGCLAVGSYQDGSNRQQAMAAAG